MIMAEEKMNNQMSPQERERGLKYILYDGMTSQVMVSLSGGAFIIAFALLLGASNLIIGLLAAGPFLGNIFQIPAALVIERVGRRKLISILGSLVSRAWLLVFALIPLVFRPFGISVLIMGIFLSGATAAFSTCAWSSWMRDLVPVETRGRYFSRRMTLGLTLAMPIALVAGRFIDFWKVRFPAQATFGYSVLFLIAFGFGLGSILALRAAPEPQMGKPREKVSVWKTINTPFKDENFKKMLRFTIPWAIAFNFAVPFFVVYMLKRIHLSLSTVMILSVISQLFHVLFLRIWGPLTDKFSNKSVMQVSGILLLICVIAWPFTTLPEIYAATFPLLVLIHVFAGIAIAGVSIASYNIVLKLAPPANSTAYLAVNGALVSLGMAVGPILGGLLADILVFMELSLTFRWLASEGGWTAYLLSFKGLDFLFFVAFILGLYALYRLSLVQEKGEVPKKVVYREFLSETRRTIRNISSVGGLSQLVYLPIALYTRRERKSK